MSSKINVTLKPIEKVVQVYSGRPGCMCGCQGTYWEDKKAIKRIYNVMAKNSNNVYSYNDAIDHFACLDYSPNRSYVVYYK